MIAGERWQGSKGGALLLHLSALCLTFIRATAWINTPNLVSPMKLQHQHQHQRRLLCQRQLGSCSRYNDGRSAVVAHRRSTGKAVRMIATASPESTTTTETTGAAGTKKNPPPSSTAIVGGGPAGLAVALMLARRGYRDITVLERLSEPPPPASEQWGNPERSYNLGLGGRGQVSLAKLGAAERVLSWCAEAAVIARDRLTSCLLEEIRETYPDAITVRFNVECVDVKWLECEAGGDGGDGGRGATLMLKSGAENDEASTSELTAEFVVAADGVKSTIRDRLESDKELTRALSGGAVRVKRFPRKNEFAYKVVPFKIGNGWRNDLNYSYRTKEEITLEALPTKEGMQVAVLLHRPGDPRVEGLTNAAEARALFEKLFPPFADMITDEAYERLARQEASRLPNFSYTGPILHLGKSAVLLGDAIKSVKPYFGLGANSAFEDCIMLERCLDETGDDMAAALPLYSRRRAPEAKDLVELSRGFDRTGVAGFFGFVLPLIVDTIFHRAAPKVFKPNTIALLQKEHLTFRHVRLRKALDRVMQGAVLAAVGAAVFAVARMGVRALLPFVMSFIR